MDAANEWEKAASEASGITTEALDAKVLDMLKKRAEYEAKKEEASNLYKEYEQAEYELLETLQQCGKTKYIVEGVGTASVGMKKSTQVPKDVNSKREMLAYFQGLGEMEYLNFVSVNSMTLNSYINAQLENDPDFTIPGVGPQTISPTLRFTKARGTK